MMAGIVNTCVQAAPIILTLIRAKKRKSTRTFDDLCYILETKFQKIVDSAIIRWNTILYFSEIMKQLN